jgi:hypothetical protein
MQKQTTHRRGIQTAGDACLISSGDTYDTVTFAFGSAPACNGSVNVDSRAVPPIRRFYRK